MNVFIDTNVLLSFFHFSKDDVNLLREVFISQKKGRVKVHVTTHLVDEFYRNREAKVAEALKGYDQIKTLPRLPSFMEEFPSYTKAITLSKELTKCLSSLRREAMDLVEANELDADIFVQQIFEKAETIESSDSDIDKAERRGKLRRPPGKPGSLGDAIHWEGLLRAVPDDQDLHLISADGDFASKLKSNEASGYLSSEWNEKKKSKLYLYQDLSSFVSLHTDGKHLSFDVEKKELIEYLGHSASYTRTHSIVAQLEKYSNFSRAEAIAIFEAAENNSQVRTIDTDNDVRELLMRAGEAHKKQLPDYAKKRLSKVSA